MIRNFAAAVARYRRQRENVRVLGRLSDEQLYDIGMTRVDVRQLRDRARRMG